MNKNVLVILAVVIVGVLGGGLYLLWQAQSQSPQVVVELEPIDTSTWETYQSEEDGYEIKHPFGWEITHRNAPVRYVDVIEFHKTKTVPSPDLNNVMNVIDSQSVQVGIVGTSQGNPPTEEWYRQGWEPLGDYDLRFVSFEETTFRDLPALQVRHKDGGELFFPKDSTSIVRLAWEVYSEENQEFLMRSTEQIFNQMVETFRFVN